MGWEHGYYSESAYTCGYYREMAPNWLDFAALIRGQAPPRPYEGVPFRYLELGCGMGFGLCLLAALYPEGEFVGIDFLPDHIAHAHGLVASLGLTNISFLEADFINLQHQPSSPWSGGYPGPDPFHYVAAHGIATWVIEPVQAALLALAARSLLPGGLFYCSYNTFPGWLQRTAFQQVLRLEQDRSDPSNPSQAIQRAVATVETLLGTAEAPSALSSGMPQLAVDLAAIKSQDQTYLNQEYFNEGWQPLYVAEMLRRCRQHKLTLISTATLPELFPQLLPESIRSSVIGQSNSLMRETIIDLATMQAFRRDLFVKGRRQLSPGQREQRLAELRFRRQAEDPVSDYRFECSFGTVIGSPEVHGEAEQALADSPLNFDDWSFALRKPLEELQVTAALLLHGNRIALDRSFAAPRAIDHCLPLNSALIDLMIAGCPYQTLAAPVIGNGVGLNVVQALMLRALSEGLDGEQLTLCLQHGLSQLGATLRGTKNEPITDPPAQLRFLRKAQKNFIAQTLPRLRKLGVWPEDPGTDQPS